LEKKLKISSKVKILILQRENIEQNKPLLLEIAAEELVGNGRSVKVTKGLER
jgi:hypothetical protein